MELGRLIMVRTWFVHLMIGAIVLLVGSNVITLFMLCRDNRKVLNAKNNIVDVSKRFNRQVTNSLSVVYRNKNLIDDKEVIIGR
jgi:predicted RND superfamily exporter protein